MSQIEYRAATLGVHRQYWTAEEEEILKQYYSVEGTQVSTRLPNKTKAAILKKANHLNLRFISDWSAEEDEIIRNFYSSEGGKILTRLPNRTKRMIEHRAKILNIEAPKQQWTAEELKILQEYYPSGGAAEVLKYLPSRTSAQIFAKANDLNLVANSIKKQVILLEQQLTFESVSNAVRWYNSIHNTKKIAILNCCSKKSRMAGGFHWAYLTDFENSGLSSEQYIAAIENNFGEKNLSN